MTPGSGGNGPALALVRLMTELPRGPRREGAFALWLTLRVVEDLGADPPHPERAVKRRTALLERRLSSLTLLPALRRGLTAALLLLDEGSVKEPRLILQQLVIPARDGVGPEAAEAVQRAAQ
jgi:hypothetical protein